MENGLEGTGIDGHDEIFFCFFFGRVILRNPSL